MIEDKHLKNNLETDLNLSLSSSINEITEPSFTSKEKTLIDAIKESKVERFTPDFTGFEIKTKEQAINFLDKLTKHGDDLFVFDRKNLTLIFNPQIKTRFQEIENCKKNMNFIDKYFTKIRIDLINKLSTGYISYYEKEINSISSSQRSFISFYNDGLRGEEGSYENPLVIPRWAELKLKKETDYIISLNCNGDTPPVILLPKHKYGLPVHIKLSEKIKLETETKPNGEIYSFKKLFFRFNDSSFTQCAIAYAFKLTNKGKNLGGTTLILTPEYAKSSLVVYEDFDKEKLYFLPKLSTV